MMTAIPGSSAVFLGGVVAYANAVKQTALGVSPAVLAEHGAVSEPVARAMATGARDRIGSDIAVAITGIAGPDGGSADKPVGTVDIAVATASTCSYKRLRLYGDREVIQHAAALWALKLVWDHLVAAGLAEVEDLDGGPQGGLRSR